MVSPITGKIDVHNHFVPPFYAKAVADAGGDPSGWATPNWTTESAKEIMQKAGIKTAILSLTAPGVEIASGEKAQIRLARDVNEYAAKLRDENPEHLGFFAALPSLLNRNAALAEIKYALDTLKADGVTLFTRYGDEEYYLGHVEFGPIWEELNRRKAVVFIHPTRPVNTNLIHPQLPQPVLDYAHESARTAMDLILSGTKRAFPDCKVILSHGGGTLPILLSRAVGLIPNLPPNFKVQRSSSDIVEDARTFYVDLALATAPEVLDLVMKTFLSDRILFGSDTPYAPEKAVLGFNECLNNYSLSEDMREKVSQSNALALFPRLRN